VETTAVIHRTRWVEHECSRPGLFRFWADRLICSRLPIFRLSKIGATCGQGVSFPKAGGGIFASDIRPFAGQGTGRDSMRLGFIRP